jgi:hypothetical protein
MQFFIKVVVCTFRNAMAQGKSGIHPSISLNEIPWRGNTIAINGTNIAVAKRIVFLAGCMEVTDEDTSNAGYRYDRPVLMYDTCSRVCEPNQRSARAAGGNPNRYTRSRNRYNSNGCDNSYTGNHRNSSNNRNGTGNIDNRNRNNHSNANAHKPIDLAINRWE